MSKTIDIEFCLNEEEFAEIVGKESKINQNINTIVISNTPNVEKAAELLTKIWFKESIQKFQNLFGIIFKIGDKFDETLDFKSFILCPGFEGSIFVTFQSTNESKTCWKVRDHDKLYSTSIDDDSTECITAFFHEFLIEELKNGRTGIQEDFQFKERIRLQEIADKNGRNLLTLAVLKSRHDVVQNLLNYEFETDDAIDQAWKLFVENGANEEKREIINKIILELLKSNSKVPDGFAYDNSSEDVKKFIDKCESMHNDVNEDRFDELKDKLESEANLIHFYNRNKQSLLAYAIQQKKYKIFDYLEHGLTIGSHENIEEVYQNINNDRRARTLRLKHEENSIIYKENHLLQLRLNSRIGNNDRFHQTRWNLIEEALITMNKNSYCKKILKVAAECKKLRIYFDFKHDSAYYLDPTSSIYTKGIIYSGGSIFIGAKFLTDDNSKFYVFGVLAHELCHLATFLTFMNPNYDPFPLGESQQKTRFDSQVMVECNLKKDLEFTINNVFNSYDGEIQNSEMIVTYPQVLMIYHDKQENIVDLKKDFSELVNYSKEVVEPALEKALPVLKILNDESQNIKYEQLTKPMKAKFLHSKILFQGAETTLFDLIGHDKEILKLLKSEEIRKILLKNENIFIVNMDEEELDIELERNFLLQMEKQQIDKMQGDDSKYTKYVEEHKKSFKQISDDVSDSKVFILVDHAGTGKTTFFKHAAKQLKQKYRNFWVSFINLRKSGKVLEKYKKIKNDLSKDKILSILIEIIDVKSEIEKKIFTKLFSEGKVIMLFDGVDEISPRFTQQILCIFKHLRNSYGNQNDMNNQLWISTRPHYAPKLEHFFKTCTYSFTPLTFEEKNELIINVLICNKIEDKTRQNDIMEKVLSLVFKRVPSFWGINNIMMIQMIVDLHINNNNDTEISNINSRFMLYSAMIPLQMVKIGEKIPNSERDNDSKLNVWDVHRVLALIVIFGDDFKENFKINLEEFSMVKKWRRDKKKWTSDMIQRYGFVTVNLNDPNERNSIDFVHRTYAEFFVAQFIEKSIYDDDDDDKSEEEAERIVNLFLTVTRNYDHFDRIDIFVINFLLSKKENQKINEKFKLVFYQKVLEAHKYLTYPITLETFVNFQKYFLPIASIDSDVSKMFWKLDKDKNLLEEMISLHNPPSNLTLIAEISLGTNWHEKFNKSGVKLITDEEIDRLPARVENDPRIFNAQDFNSVYGSNIDYERNYLKLCDLIYKSFPTPEKIKFFKNMNVLSSFIRSPIQCEIIKMMRCVLDKVTFTLNPLKYFDPGSISVKTLEFIYKCIDEEFEDDQELLRAYLFKLPWCRWSSPLIKSFRTYNSEVLELTIDFYKKYKTSWVEVQNQLENADAEDFLYPIDFPLYTIYRNFIEEVFRSNTKLIADKIEKYFNGQPSNIVINSSKYSKNNFRDFLFYVFNNDEEKVVEILSKIN